MLPARNEAGTEFESPSGTTSIKSKPARIRQKKLSHPHWRRGGLPIPTILIAPPIGLDDKLQLRGGTFAGFQPLSA